MANEKKIKGEATLKLTFPSAREAKAAYDSLLQEADFSHRGGSKVTLKGNSLWECKSCGGVFAGGAYSLSTPSGEVARRLILEQRR